MQGSTVTEIWLKPPKIVTYSNSKLITREENLLVCSFLFPTKYYQAPFYVHGERVLNPHEMYRGKRFFYADRFYSLLEFYGNDDKLKALYFDLSLPAILQDDKVIITDIKLDIFYFVESKKVFLLDQEEFDEAVRSGLYSPDEIDACERTASFIMSSIKQGRMEDIFTNYEKSMPDDWTRYKTIVF